MIQIVQKHVATIVEDGAEDGVCVLTEVKPRVLTQVTSVPDSLGSADTVVALSGCDASAVSSRGQRSNL
jgi:hypothetical protein